MASSAIVDLLWEKGALLLDEPRQLMQDWDLGEVQDRAFLDAVVLHLLQQHVGVHLHGVLGSSRPRSTWRASPYYCRCWTRRPRWHMYATTALRLWPPRHHGGREPLSSVHAQPADATSETTRSARRISGAATAGAGPPAGLT